MSSAPLDAGTIDAGIIDVINTTWGFINSPVNGCGSYLRLMKARSIDTSPPPSQPQVSDLASASARWKLPATLRWGFTAFMAVLVPIYWVHYGPANFLYFCDVALFLALAAVWTERPIYASMAAVGVLVPQLLWCVDLVLHLVGFNYAGMTNYMFDANKPLYLRLLSLFHAGCRLCCFSSWRSWGMIDGRSRPGRRWRLSSAWWASFCCQLQGRSRRGAMMQ
ncbi:hypothetical protein [Verrucomicrobium spinosum]|uniref:hypothetical protein n=1 Tax=Verrucomicrobium spinosum TaxID=2736 RepID=UPI0009463BD0|nr:hypothetical protein [Verrucomicrobium spinosum]